jgi:hypothetical protein
LRGHTFCAGCEDRFSKNGEKWVLANIAKGYREPCPLQEALMPETPIFVGDNINVYAGRKISGLDIDKLIYYGMSIFWRGASRVWKSSKGAVAPAVDLGVFFEPIRQFLLGGPVPDDVFLVIMVHNLKPVWNASFPVLPATETSGDFYWFYVNGLGFRLYLGKDIPPGIRNICALHNPDGPVVVDRGFGEMVFQFIKEQLKASEKSEGVQSLLKSRNAV